MNSELVTLSTENARLREALAGLVDKLDEIHANRDFAGVWSFYHAHGMQYRGPTWVDALASARAAIGRVAK